MRGLRGLFTAMLGGATSALFFLAFLRGGAGGAILFAMASLPLFIVGLSQGSAFALLAGMIGTGLATEVAGPDLAAQFLVVDVLPAMVLVPVALANGVPFRLRLRRKEVTSVDDWGDEIAPQDAPTSKRKGLGPGLMPARQVPGTGIEASVFDRARHREKAGAPERSALSLGVIGGRLVAVLVTIGVVVFAILFLHLLKAGGLQAMSEHFAAESLKQAQANFSADVAASLKNTSAQMVGSIMPGIGISLWLSLIAVNGVLAQGALASFNWGLRPPPAMAAIAVPRWVVFAFAAALAAAVLGHGTMAFVGLNLAIIMSVALVFAGLAVLHAMAQRWPARGFFLIAIYAVGGILVWPIMLIAILGLVDQSFDLRRRLAGSASRGEK